MLYLSDLIYVDIPTDTFKGSYQTYSVYMVDVNGGYNDVYVGQIYGMGGNLRLYLNDIINSYTYDNSYITNHVYVEGGENTTPSGVLFKAGVTLANGDLYEVDCYPYIMNCYMDAKIPPAYGFPDLNSSAMIVSNLLEQRTTVLPRVPRLPFSTKSFFFSTLIATSEGWRQLYTEGESEVFYLVGCQNDIPNENPISFANPGSVNTVTVNEYNLMGLTYDADTIYFSGRGDSISGGIPVAKIDECPAEYYLIWIDRTGAYQCQPFSGKNILTEDVKTSYRTDLIDSQIPYNKEVVNKWKLNSGWLTDGEYKAFESVLTSKYVYLYNTKVDQGWDVNVETNSWVEKTKENNKLFNMQLDVKSARKQTIRY